MVRQGMSITIFPHEHKTDTFRVFLNSTGWEGDRCVVSREIVYFDLTALPTEVPAGDFPRWIEGMLELVVDKAQQLIIGRTVSTASAAYAMAEKATGNPSRRM